MRQRQLLPTCQLQTRNPQKQGNVFGCSPNIKESVSAQKDGGFFPDWKKVLDAPSFVILKRTFSFWKNTCVLLLQVARRRDRETGVDSVDFELKYMSQLNIGETLFNAEPCGMDLGGCRLQDLSLTGIGDRKQE